MATWDVTDVTTPTTGANARIAAASSGDVIRFMNAGNFTGTDVTVGVAGLTLIGETPRTNGPRRINIAAANTTIADLKVQCDQAYLSKTIQSNAFRLPAMLLCTGANTNGLIIQNNLVRCGNPDAGFADFNVTDDSNVAFGPLVTVGTGGNTGVAGGWPLGTVEFFDPNTSTPKGATVGGTPGLTIATADANGLLPVIVLTGSYRILHKTAGGVQIRDDLNTTTVPTYVNNVNYLYNLPRGFDASRLKGSVWIEGNTFSDFSDILKFGVDGNPDAVDVVIRRNDLLRPYQDFISYGLTTLAQGVKAVVNRIEHTGNLYQDCFANVQDMTNPHGDGDQVFSADLGSSTVGDAAYNTITPIPNVLIAGNTYFQSPGCRGSASATFLSDVPPGFPFIGPRIVENFRFGRIDGRGVVISNDRTFLHSGVLRIAIGAHAAYISGNYNVGFPTYNTPSNREKTQNLFTGVKGSGSASLMTVGAISDDYVAGDGIPNGVVRFYTPGTLTAKNAYSDFARTTPITSATADANGVLPPVYFKDTEGVSPYLGIYRVRHETAGAVVLMDLETNAAPTRAMRPKGGSRNLIARNFTERVDPSTGNSDATGANVITGAKSIVSTSLDTWLAATPAWASMTTPATLFSNTALKGAFASVDAVHVNSANWTAFRNRWSQTVKPALTPFIAFVDLLDQPLNTLTTSNWQFVHVGGSFSIVGGEYRVASDYDGTGAGAWSSAATTLTNGQFVQLRTTSSTVQGVVVPVTTTLAGISAIWKVYTLSVTAFPRVNFNATQSWRSASLAFASPAEAKQLTFAWRGLVTRPAATMTLVGASLTSIGLAHISLQILSTGAMRLSINNPSGTLILSVSTVGTLLPAATPTEIEFLCSVNMAEDSATGLKIYINGVGQSIIPATYTVGEDINFAAQIRQISGFGSNNTLTAELDYIYLLAGNALDLDDSDTRLRFRANRIGPLGQGPSGTVPHWFLCANAAGWNGGTANLGTFGAFTVTTGTVTNIGSNPWPPVLALSAAATTAAPYVTGSPILMTVIPAGYAVPATTVDVSANLAGSFLADPVSLPEGEAGTTVTFTPSATGALSIGFVHSGTYTNPANLPFTITAGGGGVGNSKAVGRIRTRRRA